MQHAEEADLRTEMLGIARDFQKSFRTRAKHEIVDDLLVLQDQWRQMPGKRQRVISFEKHTQKSV